MSLFGSIRSGFKSLQNSLKRKKEPAPSQLPPEISDIDITIAKLKSEKRKINENIRKASCESTAYLNQAKKELAEGNKEMAKRYFTLHQSRKKRVDVLNASLIRIDEQIDLINDTQATASFVDILRESTSTIKGMKDSIGDVEDIEELARAQQEMKEFLGEMDDVLCNGDDDEVSEELMNELNEMINEIPLDLPSVPEIPENPEIVPENSSALPILEE